MAFQIPTLQTIIDRVKGDLSSRLGNSNSLIKGSLANVLAYVLAGAVWGVYQYQSWIADQVMPDTAEGEYLARWARIWGKLRTAATKADGTIIVTAVAGASLADEAVLQRNDRVEYIVTGGPYAWAVSGNQDVTVEAVEAGDAGNYTYSSDAYLELVSAPAGVVAKCPLGPIASPAGLTGGTDEETDASLLQRVLLRIQNPPQGGAVGDYEQWTQDALSTVENVWVHTPDDGLPDGEVDIRFTVTGTGTDLIPDGPTVTEVSDYVTSTTRKPVTANVTVAAPVGHAVTLTITLVKEPDADLADVKAAILAELESMFADQADVSIAGSTLPNSYLLDAIGNATGVDYFSLDAVDGGAGTDDVVLAAYEYPTIVAGGITWS